MVSIETLRALLIRRSFGPGYGAQLTGKHTVSVCRRLKIFSCGRAPWRRRYKERRLPFVVEIWSRRRLNHSDHLSFVFGRPQHPSKPFINSAVLHGCILNLLCSVAGPSFLISIDASWLYISRPWIVFLEGLIRFWPAGFLGCLNDAFEF